MSKQIPRKTLEIQQLKKYTQNTKQKITRQRSTTRSTTNTNTEEQEVKNTKFNMPRNS